jgi:hypothetical protein
MDQLFLDGRMIDIVIAVLLLETLLVWAVWRRRWALMPTLLSGLMLMLAWRSTLAGLGWIWIAMPMLAAGAAHGWDLWRRWPMAGVRARAK